LVCTTVDEVAIENIVDALHISMPVARKSELPEEQQKITQLLYNQQLILEAHASSPANHSNASLQSTAHHLAVNVTKDFAGRLYVNEDLLAS